MVTLLAGSGAGNAEIELVGNDLVNRIDSFIQDAHEDQEATSSQLIYDADRGEKEDLAEVVVMALATEEFDEIVKAQKFLDRRDDTTSADLLIEVLQEEIDIEEAHVLNKVWEAA